MRDEINIVKLGGLEELNGFDKSNGLGQLINSSMQNMH